MITNTTYNGISERIGDILVKNNLWSLLNFTPSLFIVDEATMQLRLRQIVYHDIVSPRVRKLTSVLLCVYIYTSTDVSFNCLLRHLNYLTSVWLVNFEYRFPCVFSVVGCQYFISQVNWLKWYLSVLFPDGDTMNVLFATNLLGLQKIIAYEYNIFNVWKEIDNKFNTKFITTTKEIKDAASIKSLIFSMGLFNP